MQMTEAHYEQLWKIIDREENGWITPSQFKNVLEAYETWTYEKSYKATMEEIYSDLNANQSVVDTTKVYGLTNTVKYMNSAGYELIVNIIGIINVFSLIVRHFT